MACGGNELVFQKPNLKFWLYTQIESQKYRGLEWMDPVNLTFKLPWVKENDPHSEEYYKLFHDWWQRDLKEPCESSKAKRNFRSAINHSKHFIAIGKEDKQTESYKIYRFVLSPQEMAEMQTSKRSNISEPSPFSHADDMSYQSVGPYNQQQHGNNFLPPGVNNLNITNQMYGNQSPIGQEMNPNIVAGESMTFNNQVAHHASQEYADNRIASDDVDMSSIPSFDSERATSLTINGLAKMGIKKADLASCEFTIEYIGRHQKSGTLHNMNYNSKFVYGNPEIIRGAENVLYLQQSRFFSNQLHILDDPIANNSKRLMTLLQGMDDGISIWFDMTDLCIKVVRHCLTHVFSFDVVDQNNHLCSLKRGREYTIFSFHNFLYARNSSSMLSEVIPPDPKVELIAGVRPGEKGAVSKGVKIILKPCGALKLLDREDVSSLQELCVSLDSLSIDRT